MTSRRDLIAGVLTAFPAYAMLAELGVARAGDTSGDTVAHWVGRQHDLALALSHGHLMPDHWQAEVEALAREVDIEALMAAIGRAGGRDVGRGLPTYPAKRLIQFRDAHGVRRQLRYAAALFDFDRGNVITPHAHRNMVSAHIVTRGRFRVRTFDRVRDDGDALIVRPSGDDILTVGDVSSIGPMHRNVHWFVPLTDRAATFDIIVSGLAADGPRYAVEAIDPVRGRPLPDGTIRAPLIDFESASRFYTADV